MKTIINEDGKKVEIEIDVEDTTIEVEENETSTFTFTYKKTILSKVRRILPILSLMAFFLCGFLVEGGWTWSWSLLFISPIFETILKFRKKGLKKIVLAILDLIIIAGIIILGCTLHIWSWCWVLFFLIPIVHIILE